MNYYLKVYKLFSNLVAYFDGLMSIIRLRPKNESCLFMSLEYACKISDHLGMCNFIYGPFSTSYPVLDSLFRDYYFMWIEDDFGKVLNWKVVED